MKRPYQIIGKRNRKELVRFLVKIGQALLPIVELIEESRMAVDELIDVVGGRRSRRCCCSRPKGSRARRTDMLSRTTAFKGGVVTLERSQDTSV